MMRVQKIRVPYTGLLGWIVVDGEHLTVKVLNEYLSICIDWGDRRTRSGRTLIIYKLLGVLG